MKPVKLLINEALALRSFAKLAEVYAAKSDFTPQQDGEILNRWFS